MSDTNRSEVITGMADALSLKLYYLTEIVKVVAFAAEARRTLNGIDDVLHYRPEMRKAISDGVAYATNWEEMPDCTSGTLDFVAKELGSVNSGFTEALYGVVRQLNSATHEAP